jgi:hypothetical protein
MEILEDKVIPENRASETGMYETRDLRPRLLSGAASAQAV